MTEDSDESIAIVILPLLIIRDRFRDILIDSFAEPDYLRRSGGEIFRKTGSPQTRHTRSECAILGDNLHQIESRFDPQPDVNRGDPFDRPARSFTLRFCYFFRSELRLLHVLGDILDDRRGMIAKYPGGQAFAAREGLRKSLPLSDDLLAICFYEFRKTHRLTSVL